MTECDKHKDCILDKETCEWLYKKNGKYYCEETFESEASTEGEETT